MKSSEFINWDNLKNIPFAECQVVEDKENKDIDIYYRGEMVFTDYDHVGHYLRNAIVSDYKAKKCRLGKPCQSLVAPELHPGKL